MLTVFRDMKGPMMFDFLEKDTTINSTPNYQLHRQNSPYLLNDLRVLNAYRKPTEIYIFLRDNIRS